jgi:hypothetical protein
MLSASEREPEPVVDPWVTLTAIALATSQIRVGVFMTPLARRRPWDVARCDVADDIDPAATISRYEQAGATWWAELCSDTPDEQRRRIRQGPAGRQ